MCLTVAKANPVEFEAMVFNRREAREFASHAKAAGTKRGKVQYIRKADWFAICS